MAHLLPAGYILTLSASSAFGRRPGFWDRVPSIPTRAAAVQAGRRIPETGCTGRPLMAAVSLSGSAPGPAPRPRVSAPAAGVYEVPQQFQIRKHHPWFY